MGLNSPGRHKGGQTARNRADDAGNVTRAVLTPIAIHFEEHFYLSDPEAFLDEQT
ncbi:hypothetical protein D3C87_1818050 [compost metagenome]